jgi:two-component sensor histidine kinase
MRIFILLSTLIICFNLNARKVASLDDFIKIKDQDDQIKYLYSYYDRNYLDYSTFLSFYPYLENSKRDRVLFYWHYKHVNNMWGIVMPQSQLDIDYSKMMELSKNPENSIERSVAIFSQTIFKYSQKQISEQNIYYNYLQCYHQIKSNGILNYKIYGIDIITSEIGRNFYDVGDYDNALECLLLADSLTHPRSGYKNMMLNLIESIYAKKKDYKSAAKYAQLNFNINKALEKLKINSQQYHKYWQCLLGLNLAYYNLLMNDTIKSKSYLNEAVTNYVQNYNYKILGDVVGEFDVLQILIQTKQLLGQVSETDTLLKRSLLLKKFLDIDYQRNQFKPIGLYKSLAVYYNYTKEYGKAYQYLNLSNELQDELNIVNDKRKVWQVESRLKAEEFVEKVAKIEEDNLKNNRIKNTVLLIIIIVLLAFVIVYFNIRKKNFLIVKQKEALEKSLNEKDLLFREVHHRVKNNLQIVSSLLLREKRKNSDSLFKSLMSNAHARIDSMALVYDNLYQSQEISFINMKTYVNELINNTNIINTRDNLNLQITTDIDEIKLNISTASSIGLILTELIINIYKHAFINRNEGNVLVRMHLNINRITLEVEDDGIGFNPNEVQSSNDKSTGLLLIKGLVRQIDGKYWFEKKEKGSHFVLEFMM